ncbi:MAG: hypothetical protein F6K65_16320 [Moorea sp. SIO3C2]|nr:hypothetical protein [Moorena sp. SIO3C2]
MLETTQLPPHTSRAAPQPPTYSLGALSVGELNSPRVAPLPTPDSRLPTPYSRLRTAECRLPTPF